MIKNVVFDIGNVLTHYAWKEHIQSFGFSEEICEKVALATVSSPQWNEFDRGVMEDEEIVDLLVKNEPSVEQEIRLMLKDVSTLVTKADYAVGWILELQKKGLKTYYLSNFSKKAEKECKEALDFIPYMDGGILSYRDKLIKPQREIYELLLSRYGLSAGECVFIDDLFSNVEAAKQCGMQGIVFTTKEEAEKKLEEMLAK